MDRRRYLIFIYYGMFQLLVFLVCWDDGEALIVVYHTIAIKIMIVLYFQWFMVLVQLFRTGNYKIDCDFLRTHLFHFFFVRKKA